MTAEEAKRRFAAARIARLATVDAAGRPHVVPVVFAVTGDCIYTIIDAKPKRTTALRRLQNVRASPHVSLLVDHYEEDWSSLWWVRADGDAVILDEMDPDSAQAHGHAKALLLGRYPQQRATGAVLAVAVTRWSGWTSW